MVHEREEPLKRQMSYCNKHTMLLEVDLGKVEEEDLVCVYMMKVEHGGYGLERPPPKKDGAMNGYEKLTAGEMCIKIVEENEPDKVEEMRAMLAKLPGREWNIFKRLKGRYNVEE